MHESLQQYLMEYIHYCPESGAFEWKKSPSANVLAGDRAGSFDTAGYWRISLKGKQYSAHRIAFLYMTGRMPSGEVDHLNGDKSDNRWCNLRPCDRFQNTKNTPVRADNRLGIKGVRLTRRGNYEAQVISMKVRHSKTFETVTEAQQWVEAKRDELHKSFARHG